MKISIILFFLVIGVVACGPEEPESIVLENEFPGNYGEVLFTYTQTFATESEEVETSFQMSARFVRVHDLERNDVRLLWGEGIPENLGRRGGCQRSSIPIRAPREHVFGGSLELLDAGELTLRLAEEEVRVANWSFPSVYGVVAGVLYGGEELDAEFRSDDQYHIIASGGEALGPFEVALDAPEGFDGLMLSGSEVGLEAVVLEPEQPLELRWEPGRVAEEVLIELSFEQFGSEQRIVCRSSDDGAEVIPASLVSQLWDPGVQAVRLTVSRITRTSFEAEGLEDAEAMFVVSAIVPLSDF